MLVGTFYSMLLCVILGKINISVFSKSTGRNSLLTGLISKAERPEYKKHDWTIRRQFFNFSAYGYLILHFVNM